MAAKKNANNDELNIPVSTGAVKLEAEPERTQPADNASTGAVKFDSEPVETTVPHYTEDVVVSAQTPGPVTVTASWLSKAEAKVVTAPEKAPKDDTTRAETKSE
jgi:hypothetical protein